MFDYWLCYLKTKLKQKLLLIIKQATNYNIYKNVSEMVKIGKEVSEPFLINKGFKLFQLIKVSNKVVACR